MRYWWTTLDLLLILWLSVWVLRFSPNLRRLDSDFDLFLSFSTLALFSRYICCLNGVKPSFPVIVMIMRLVVPCVYQLQSVINDSCVWFLTSILSSPYQLKVTLAINTSSVRFLTAPHQLKFDSSSVNRQLINALQESLALDNYEQNIKFVKKLSDAFFFLG